MNKGWSTDYSSNNVIILDTETTGLPSGRTLQHYQEIRMTEICWVLVQQNRIVATKQFLLKSCRAALAETPPHPSIQVTLEEIDRDGVEWEVVLAQLEQDLPLYDRIVAHNIRFDMGMILSELSRLGDRGQRLGDQILNKRWVDTMRCSGRCLKLAELHYRLTRQKLTDGHRAEADVRATHRIYLELQRLDE